VAIVDVPRKRLIKVAESYDPEQIRRAVASAMSKLH
jgi:hypothetical protein